MPRLASSVKGLVRKPWQELSSYDKADYYKDYYGVIIVRTLLFLATLIWMQHLMVWRVPWLQPKSLEGAAGTRGSMRAG